MQVIPVKRQDIDYGKLGQLVGQAINPQQALQKQLLPLLLKEQYTSRLAERRQRNLINQLSQGGNGANGDWEISLGPSGVTYKQKSPKQKLEDRRARQDLEFYGGGGSPQIPGVVSRATGGPTQGGPVAGPQVMGAIPSQVVGSPTGVLNEAAPMGIPSNLPPSEQQKFAAKAIEGQLKGAQKGKDKWTTEAADRRIKFAVMTPKLQEYMNFGGRAYQELKDVASERGIKLDFEKGGINALLAAATKNVAMRLKLTPLMVALDRLRPELGTELMRQLGAFRSATMAKRFEDTLAQFSGDVREDIANMSSTITKNKANVVLLDPETGRELSPEEKEVKMQGFEANLIRKYNYMYRKMGIMTKPYTAGRSLKWLAQKGEFSPAEQRLIDNASADNPDYSRVAITAKLIERGIL